jgi:hypothetical protein
MILLIVGFRRVDTTMSVPESNGQSVVGLNLRGQFSDFAEPDAELIVAGAVLAVLCTDLLIAERFELRESFFESRGHICVVSEPKKWDNGEDQRARPELLASIEASVGRAPLNWMLGAQ